MNTWLDRLLARLMTLWAAMEYRQIIKNYREDQGLSEAELLEKSWALPAGKGVR